MVAPSREPANTLFPFDHCLPSNTMIHKNSNMDMDINNPRGRSSNSSTNSSRELSVHSGVSSVPYTERMEALNNSSSWAEQVEENLLQEITLSYASPKEERTTFANEASATTHMAEPHGEHVENVDTNTCQSQGLESSAIPYSVNQSGEIYGMVVCTPFLFSD